MDLYKWFLYPSLSPETSRASFFGILFGDRNDRTPIPVVVFHFTLAINPIVWEAIGHPPQKNALNLCNYCSSLLKLWRPHHEWWLAMGVISKNGCCPMDSMVDVQPFQLKDPWPFACPWQACPCPWPNLGRSLIFCRWGARSTYENTRQLVYFDHFDLCCYHMLSWLCVLHFLLRNLAKMSDGETCSSKKGQVNPCSLQLRGDADGKAHCHHLFKGFCFRRTGWQLRNQKVCDTNWCQLVWKKGWIPIF